jgi:hypothetical protein
VSKLGRATFLAGVVLAVLTQPVVAGPPATVTIETTRQGPVGSFESSGAISDSGTFAVTQPAFGGPGPGTFVIVHATETFTGTDGTFTLVRTLRVTWGADPAVRIINGNWVVISGTGAYENLQAHGTVSGTVQGFPPSEVFTLTYTGTVDHD